LALGILAAAAVAIAAVVLKDDRPPRPDGMVWIPGGEFVMGCAESQDQDAPPHKVSVGGFWMDETEVTNDEFTKFVAATNYVTVAERKPYPNELPANVPAANNVPFSAVFRCADCDAKSCDEENSRLAMANKPQLPPPWWEMSVGASWRHPDGAKSTIEGKGNYPAVHLSWEDAASYAKWAGKRLPSEAEWEFAARGGLNEATYAWGNDPQGKDGKYHANTYQGRFPATVEGKDGFAGLAPVRSFSPNGYGLFDMSGNAWEWVQDWYAADYYQISPKKNPTGPAEGSAGPDGKPQKVRRGGSFLCADEYCRRYLPGTRDKGATDDCASHTGFRCVKDAK
jgi:formylglycine-generating enzyme required for sulfatase activity